MRFSRVLFVSISMSVFFSSCYSNTTKVVLSNGTVLEMKKKYKSDSSFFVRKENVYIELDADSLQPKCLRHENEVVNVQGISYVRLIGIPKYPARVLPATVLADN
ncbi:MAG: hypothetical protein WCO35_03200 [Candidatus Nomurabacteria bacterium]